MYTQRRNNGEGEGRQAPRRAHHMWSAQADERGVPQVRRNKLEAEKFEGVDEERRNASSDLSRRIAAEKCAAYLGLFGADMVDDPTLISEIPEGVARRFNAADRSNEAPRVYSWEELRRAFGAEHIDHARQSVAQGIKVRLASKYLNLPFMVTADILDQLADVPRGDVRAAVMYLKQGDQAKTAAKDEVVARVAEVLSGYIEPGSHRMAADEKAQAYWASYYGPYGEELVREVKKRVQADLAREWLRKNGVDEAAADYWKSYFGEYGEKWVSVVPKMLSPSNAKK